MRINLQPDMSIEPGHQWIILPATPEGVAMFQLLTRDSAESIKTPDGGYEIHVPHSADVDARIVELINELAHVRFSAPGLVQLTLTEGVQE